MGEVVDDGGNKVRNFTDYKNSNRENNKMQAFITGSHAYGEPNENSDVDLVALVDEPALELLKTICDKIEDKPCFGVPLVFGRLNLVACTSTLLYDKARIATLALKQRSKKDKRPIPKEEARTFFEQNGLFKSAEDFKSRFPRREPKTKGPS